MFPSLVWSKGIERWRQSKANPKYKLGLHGFLHPSLQVSANHLEYCVMRFQYIVEVVLQREGANIVEKQLTLKRLADIAIDIFSMTAVLSRASRSYCTGIQNASSEVSSCSLSF